MSNVSVERYDDFTGGLNLRADQFQLARNESPDMMNVEIDPRGGLFSRGAMREINSTAITGSWNPKSLHAFYGHNPRMMLANNTSVFWSDAGNFTQLSFGAGTPVVASNTNGASFANWGQFLYVATGATGTATYTWQTTDTYATAVPTIAAAGDFNDNYNSPSRNHFPRCELVITHANKMFAAGTNDHGTIYPNRLRYSHEAEPEDWATTDYIDFLGGGEGIKALAVFSGQLLVFKQHSIYIVYGYQTSDFSVVELTSRLGVEAQNKVTVTEQGVYFYSHPNGLFFYNGSSIVDLSMNFNSIYPNGYINDAAVSAVTLGYMNRRVWMSMPYSKTTQATNATVNLVYDPSLGSAGAYVMFSTSDGRGVLCGQDFVSSTGATYGLAIHPTLPRVVKVDQFNNETDLLGGTESAFTSYYRTGWVDGRSYSMKKMWRRPDIIVKQANTSRVINIKVYHNFEEALGNERKNFNLTLSASGRGMKWGSGLWGQDKWGVLAEGAQLLRGSNLGLARSVQLLFTGPSGLSWGIDSIAYKFNTRKITG